MKLETIHLNTDRKTVQHWRRSRPSLVTLNAARWRKVFANADWLEPYQIQDLGYDMLGWGADFVGGLTGIKAENCYHNPGAKEEAWGTTCQRIETVAHALVIAHRIGLSIASLDVLAPLVARIKKRAMLSSPELTILWMMREPSLLMRPAHIVWKHSLDQFSDEAEFARLADGRIAVAFKPSEDTGVEVLLRPIARLTTKIKGDLASAGFLYCPGGFARLSEWLAGAPRVTGIS